MGPAQAMLTTFHPFLDLPLHLQLKIWDYALPHPIRQHFVIKVANIRPNANNSRPLSRPWTDHWPLEIRLPVFKTSINQSTDTDLPPNHFPFAPLYTPLTHPNQLFRPGIDTLTIIVLYPSVPFDYCLLKEHFLERALTELFGDNSEDVQEQLRNLIIEVGGEGTQVVGGRERYTVNMFDLLRETYRMLGRWSEVENE